MRRTTNGIASYFAYDGEREILECDGGGGLLSYALYGIGVDEVIVRLNHGSWQLPFQDYLGSTSAIAIASGEIKEQYRYDAFGTPEFRSGPVAGDPRGTLQYTGTLNNNRVLFTGRQWMARYGFYEYRARAYNPELGRFTSEDPKGFKAGDTNLFRYCGNDPNDKTDPMGLQQIAVEQSYTGVAEYQKLMVVTGSWIPQWVTLATLPISFTTSGNYKDSNAAHHVVDAASPSLDGLKGHTIALGKVTEGQGQFGGKMLNANVNIDYWLRATRYDSLEREHTFGVEGGGSKTKGILEAGGVWDRFKTQWSAGISGFFPKTRLQSSLDSALADAHREQGGTWDGPGGSHHVPW